MSLGEGEALSGGVDYVVVGCWSEHGLQCGCGVLACVHGVALAFVQIFLSLCWPLSLSLFGLCFLCFALCSNFL